MTDLLSKGVKATVIYADCIYEEKGFLREKPNWIDLCYDLLDDSGVMYVQTDYHTSHWYRLYLEYRFGEKNFLSHLVWKNEWGNYKKDRFRQCYDDIIMYRKGKKHKFYPDRIQVPKATAKAGGLNPSGRTTKPATAWIDDIVLTTTSKERIKSSDGHLIRWQKPLSLINRLLLPVSDENDLIIDPFMGSNTTGVWCAMNSREFIGIENDLEVYELACDRLEETSDYHF